MTTETTAEKAKKPTVLQRLSLYDIALEGKLIEEILVEGDGELTPETEARMDALLKSGKPKIEGACLIIKELEASEENAAKEAKRLADRKRSFERNAEGLKNRVAIALDAAFSGKVKTDRVTAYTQKSPDRVAVEFLGQPDQLSHLHAAHPELVTTETVYSLNTETILALWEEERPERGAYAAELAEYSARHNSWTEGRLAISEVGEMPVEPRTRIPEIIRVELIEGRRFLQIR